MQPRATLQTVRGGSVLQLREGPRAGEYPIEFPHLEGNLAKEGWFAIKNASGKPAVRAADAHATGMLNRHSAETQPIRNRPRTCNRHSAGT
jgi:hypothetical protein